MSDSEDLLADDLGDPSLADYNLGIDEEDQLLADDLEHTHNAYQPEPTSYLPDPVPYQPEAVPYQPEPAPYQPEPAPYQPEPAPYHPEPTPYHPEPAPYQPEPIPYQPEPTVPINYVPETQIVPSNYVQETNQIDFRQDTFEEPKSFETECVVPTGEEGLGDGYENFNKYGERIYDVPQTNVPASPIMEVPQVVPAEVPSNGDVSPPEVHPPRERFPAERPPGAARTPQVRDIPDTLDKVYVPRANLPRADSRTTWRNPHYQQQQQRFRSHPYRHNVPQQRPPFQHQVRPQHSDFNRPPSKPLPRQQRPSFQRPTQLSPEQRPPFARPDMPPGFNSVPERFPTPGQIIFRPPVERFPPPGQEVFIPPGSQRFPPPNNQPPPPGAFGLADDGSRPNFHPRPNFPPERPPMGFRGPPPFHQRPPNFNQMRPNFNPRMPMLPPPREIIPSSINQLPQVVIRQPVPLIPSLATPPSLPPGLGNQMDLPPPPGVEQEVRMLPVQLPPNLPPGGFTGKKVLINPHFKGPLQPPVEGLTYIPTRIEKPLSPTFDSKFEGHVKNIDDAAERFIAEQRNALARAANRKPARRSPQRYIENTTIEIENEFARGRDRERELLRKQEEFINANRAGLRRRMRSPTPPRRSPSPRRTRPSPPPPSATSEESEYKRRVREQEGLRERVLRAKEVRRRKNAVALQRQLQEREREERRMQQEKEQSPEPIPPEKNPDRLEDGAYREGRIERDRYSALDPREERLPDRMPEKVEPEKPARLRERTPEKVQLPEKVQMPEKALMPEKVQMPEKTWMPDKARMPEKVQMPEKVRMLEKVRMPEKVWMPEKVRMPEKVQMPERNKGWQESVKPIERLDEYERDLTPPLPAPNDVQINSKTSEPANRLSVDLEEDALDLILEDLEGILSDDDDSGRFKEKAKPAPAPKPKPSVDLRSRLAPKPSQPRQKIVFGQEKKERKRDSPKRQLSPKRMETKRLLSPKRIETKRQLSPKRVETKRQASPKRMTKVDYDDEPAVKAVKTSRGRAEQTKAEPETAQMRRERQKIVFNKPVAALEPEEKPKPATRPTIQPFQSRRVVLQRKVQPAKPPEKSIFSRIESKATEKLEDSQPTAGIFSRAVRTAIGKTADLNRIVVQRQTSEDPKVEVEFDSDSESLNEDLLLRDDDEFLIAAVTNLPHGMTDTRLKTLAGEVQSLTLDKERRSAKIIFKTYAAAEGFKRKFNNKMVAASRLCVTLH